MGKVEMGKKVFKKAHLDIKTSHSKTNSAKVKLLKSARLSFR